jgi:hypothetical protein
MSKRSKRTSYGIQAVRKRLVGIEDLALDGTLLAVDPSCISHGSLPGYAWFNKGKLVETGTISGIRPTETLEKRLQFLGKFCREEFEEPDILAIEHIQMGGRISMQSTIRATGAIIGNFETEHVISVSPLTWQSAAIKNLKLSGNSDFEKYKDYKARIKGDEEDAKWIGRLIIELCKELING